MTMLREWAGRLWGTLRRNRTDHDLEEELRLHMELAADAARRRGHSPETTARAAAIRAGGVAQAMEALRDQRGLPWLEDLWRDLAYGCRMLAGNPGFTAVSVVSLAIGIGANTAVFSFADTLLLRPLTVPRPGDVLTVGSASATTLRPILLASYRDYVDVRDRSTSFDGLVAFRNAVAGFASGPDALPRLTIGMLATGNFFPVMGVTPELGRTFRPDEDEVPGRNAVVLLGHDFWQREFGADRSIIGRTVRLNGIEFTVIGVTPAWFTGLDQYVRYDFYAPLMMWPRLITDRTVPFEARDLRSLNVRGRLKPGVTLAQAQTELSVIGRDLERAYPDTNRNQQLTARTELQARIAAAPPIARLLVMLNLLAAAVLFVACANVAGLLASRAPLRAREIAMRLAIGAGRPRVIRQLVTESVLIAMAGGVLGLGVGYAGVTLFRQFQIPTDLPIVASFDLDRRALLVSLVVALTSAVLFGLAPAIRATGADLTSVMKAADAAGFGGRRRWGRALLVGGQVAVSVVLLVVATFVYRGFQRQLGSGPGFRTDHLLMMSVAPGQLGYSEAQAQRFFERVAEEARLVPGVQSAALTRFMPMDGLPPSITIVPEGFQFPEGKESATLGGSIVNEDYFDTIGLPILRGRGFRATDSAGAPRVAVVNEVIAEHYWPAQDPLGKRFRLDNGAGPWVEVVGVAKTSKYSFVLERPLELVYLPYRQRPAESMFLLVRSMGDPTDLVTPLRTVIRGLDANLPISNVRTMEELYRQRSVVILNVIVSLIASMGLMGLGLALAGLYGLVAHAANRRTKEIGIRMAIGADRAAVLRMVLRQGVVLALAGLGFGLLASLGADRALRSLFPGGPGGDGRTDVMAFLLVGATVLAITLLSAYVPARRAARVNPSDALRHE